MKPWLTTVLLAGCCGLSLPGSSPIAPASQPATPAIEAPPSPPAVEPEVALPPPSPPEPPSEPLPEALATALDGLWGEWEHARMRDGTPAFQTFCGWGTNRLTLAETQGRANVEYLDNAGGSFSGRVERAERAEDGSTTLHLALTYMEAGQAEEARLILRPTEFEGAMRASAETTYSHFKDLLILNRDQQGVYEHWTESCEDDGPP